MRIQSVKEQSPNFEKAYRACRRPKLDWSRERQANLEQMLRRSRSNRPDLGTQIKNLGLGAVKFVAGLRIGS